jgi:ankyrin repeat protein
MSTAIQHLHRDGVRIKSALLSIFLCCGVAGGVNGQTAAGTTAGDSQAAVCATATPLSVPEAASLAPAQLADTSNALVEAVRTGCRALVRQYMQRGWSPNTRSTDGTPILNQAVQTGDTGMIGILLQAGADPNLQDSGNNAALDAALGRENDYLIAEQLLKHGARIDVADHQGNTILLKAVKAGETAFVGVLLDAGADINHANYNRRTPLILAVMQNDAELVTILLGKGADTSVLDGARKDALAYAVDNGDWDLASLLLQHGAKINRRYPNGLTLFDMSSDSNRRLRLLTMGAKPGGANNSERAPLLSALREGDQLLAKALLKGGVDPNQLDLNGESPLVYAVSEPALHQIVPVLLKAGAKPDLGHDGYYKPALLIAIEKNYSDMIKLLLAAGADPTLTDRSDAPSNALDYAVSGNDADTVNLILAAHKWGPAELAQALSKLLRYGNSAEKIAKSADDIDRKIMALLIDHGADPRVNYPAADGESNPYCTAAQWGDNSDIQYFAARGFLPPAQCRDSNPLALAISNKHPDTAALLLSLNYIHSDNCCDQINLSIERAGIDSPSTLDELLKYCTVNRLHCDAGRALLPSIQAKQPDLKLLKLLIASQDGSSADRKLDDQAIMAAAARGLTPVVKWLLDSGARIEQVDDHGETPLGYAAASGNLDTVKFLIARGAPVNPVWNPAWTNSRIGVRPPLLYACQAGHKNTIAYLIAQGAHVTWHDRDNGPLLSWAAWNRWDDCAGLLLDAGAAPDARDGMRYTPLDRAAANKDLILVKLLVTHGAAVNENDTKFESPLESAVAGGDVEVVNYLIAHGADVNVRDWRGDTLLQQQIGLSASAQIKQALYDAGGKRCSQNKCYMD